MHIYGEMEWLQKDKYEKDQLIRRLKVRPNVTNILGLKWVLKLRKLEKRKVTALCSFGEKGKGSSRNKLLVSVISYQREMFLLLTYLRNEGKCIVRDTGGWH